jgi:hypothetical protein
MSVILALTLTLSVATLDAQPAPPSVSEPMPDLYRLHANGKYVWVSSEEYERQDESERAALLNNQTLSLLNHRHKAPQSGPDECGGGSTAGRPMLVAETLETAIREFPQVVLGTVNGSSPGFYSGNPATLLRMRVEETWRGTAKVGSDLFFVSYIVDMTFMGERFCTAKPNRAQQPTIGDRVLLLGEGLWSPDNLLAMSADFGLITLPTDQDVSLPFYYRDDGLPSDVDDFLHWARKARDR